VRIAFFVTQNIQSSEKSLTQGGSLAIALLRAEYISSRFASAKHCVISSLDGEWIKMFPWSPL
jgi:hypothetical protein